MLIASVPVYSIIHAATHREDNNDMTQYMDMYRGKVVDPALRYRVMTPYLARALPEIPSLMYSSSRQLSEEWVIEARFAVINFGFLFATAVVLFYYLHSFGCSPLESILGVFIFLVCPSVTEYAGRPMVDSAAYFFLLLGFFSIRNEATVSLAFVSLLGVFAKETTLFLPLAVILAPLGHHLKIKMLLAEVPSFVAYLWLRKILSTQGHQTLLGDSSFSGIMPLTSLIRPNVMIDLFTSFGMLWIPAVLALNRADTPLILRRWFWFVPFLIVLIVAQNLNLGRILFLAFPAVIPLVVFGLRPLLAAPAE